MVARRDIPEQGWRAMRTPQTLTILALTMLAGLCLSSCRGPAKDAATRPVASPPPSPQGPVNPDPGVTRYGCAGGEAVTAGYPDRETAVVTYRDHAYTLKRVRSADGVRYTGYGLQWWRRGDHANLAELKGGEDAATGPGLECRPAAPANDSVIHTAFDRDDWRSGLKGEVARMTGLEPATSGVTGRRSNQLSYIRVFRRVRNARGV
jgi:membrane-bound inhibitor of C-type lysozyme